jgi:hypothetical protein
MSEMDYEEQLQSEDAAETVGGATDPAEPDGSEADRVEQEQEPDGTRTA